MTTEQSNPFVLPGFGQSGEGAQNPVFAGMEMMRKAWQGMAGAGVSGFESAGMPIMSIEDLERRISELQTVESWLRLNLSMLSNTIQGLEIQRSTMTTLRSFAAQGMSEGFGGAKATDAAADSAPGSTPPDSAPDLQPYAQAAENWWNLVQQQFQSLAAATATATAQATPQSAPKAATKSTTSAKKSATKAPSAAKKSATKAATKRPTRRPN